MNTPKSFTPKVTKDPDINDETIERIEMLEARINQLEAALKNTITFETLAARLISTQELCTKKVRKQRAKRVLTPEEKAAFHAKMVAGRLAKQKASKK